MAINTKYGTTLDTVGSAEVQSKFMLSFKPIDLIVNWDRCSLTANFIAQINLLNKPEHTEVSQAMSSILNELIEFSVRFAQNVHQLSQISISQHQSFLSITSQNTTSSELAIELDDFVKKVFSEDQETLFLDILNAPQNNFTSTQLGILMIIRDYAPEISVKISKANNQLSSHDIVFQISIPITQTELSCQN